jgi:Na+/phosphate symporter
MMIAVWPLVVAVVGALVYALSSNTKASELGRITFFVGLFWLVYSLVGHTLKLGS